MTIIQKIPHNFATADEIYFHEFVGETHIAAFLNAGGNLEIEIWEDEEGEDIFVIENHIWKNVSKEFVIEKAKSMFTDN